MLKLNSRGQVPVFTDGDAVVSDSMAIMQYLEATYPSVPLLPNGKADLALACQRLHETSCLYNTVQPPFYAKMAGKVNTDEEKVMHPRLHPSHGRRPRGQQGFAAVPSLPSCMQERFQQGIEATLKEMNYFEEYLSDGRSFLIGEMFTLADVSLAVYLFFCEHFGATLDKHPNLKKFADRIRERPCFKETWPAEWLENEGNSGMDFLGDL